MLAIAFGCHRDRAPLIARRIDPTRYRPAFAPLDAIDLSRFAAAIPIELAHYDELARAALPMRRIAIVPDPALVDLCDDKLACARHLIAIGFGAHVPEIFEERPAFDHIEKPRRGEFGRGCRVVSAGSGRGGQAAPGGFFQALVPGDEEFALHLLRAGGRLRFARLVRYQMPDAHSVRSADCRPRDATFVDPRPALALFARLLDALSYEGTCCINYKLQEGRPMILEINPRIGSSLCYDITAYVDAYVGALEGL